MLYSPRQIQSLYNRAETELAADRLAAVLNIPAYVVFDNATGYNHLMAADEIALYFGREIQAGEARVVYTALPQLSADEQRDVDALAAHVRGVPALMSMCSPDDPCSIDEPCAAHAQDAALCYAAGVSTVADLAA